MDVFVNVAIHDGPKRLRIFIDGIFSLENNDLIKKRPPKIGENIISWSKRCFKGKKFAIIINGCHNFSSDLGKTINDFIEPLFDIKGKPHEGLESTFFIGNYGYTPLGVPQL